MGGLKALEPRCARARRHASDRALVTEGVGDALEARNVCARLQVPSETILDRRGVALAVDPRHDRLQFPVHGLRVPADTLRVLRHLHPADGHAARVGRLGGAKDDAALLEARNGLRGRWHVGPLKDADHAVGDEGRAVGVVNLILRGGGECNVRRDRPRALSVEEDGGRAQPGVLGDAAAALLLDGDELGELLLGEAVGLVHGPLRVGEGQHLGAEREQLLGGELRDIARARDERALARDVLPVRLKRRARKVNAAVPCRLGPDERPAPGRILACEHALELALLEPLVLAVHIPNLLGAHADVARRYVAVGPDVRRERRHKGLAEAHYLCLALALWVEVGASLARPQRHAGERILEGLLKAKELDDPRSGRGVEWK
mmetsp:Transcript_51808/g.167089  ORF Transcript_51808/g.167089 Transcript_51808/m.167089 type:complete len:376 (+) Transcript_51808:48-1175(+)